MKNTEIKITKNTLDRIIEDLELLYEISEFPCYNQLGKDKKKMRRRLKKLIKCLKDGNYDEVFQEGYEVIIE